MHPVLHLHPPLALLCWGLEARSNINVFDSSSLAQNGGDAGAGAAGAAAGGFPFLLLFMALTSTGLREVGLCS